MNSVCLRCRVFSWQELNEAHKRAWSYRQRVSGSARQASSQTVSRSLRSPVSSRPLQRGKDRYPARHPKGVGGLRHASESVASQIQVDEDRVQSLNKVYIGIGSNLGDRLGNIEDACDKINGIPGTKITQTSSLWETKAMYVEDQPNFYNAVCEVCQSFDISTTFDELLRYQQTWTQSIFSTTFRPLRTISAGCESSTKAPGQWISTSCSSKTKS
jgi:7,8-dihydro-6-hydroxymethylpterin-pyrophosphokinase (HPPK)